MGAPGAGYSKQELKTWGANNNSQEMFPGNGFLPGHMLLNAFKASLRIVLADIGQVEIKDVRSIRVVRLWNLDALRDWRKQDWINLPDAARMKIRGWPTSREKESNLQKSMYFTLTLNLAVQPWYLVWLRLQGKMHLIRPSFLQTFMNTLFNPAGRSKPKWPAQSNVIPRSPIRQAKNEQPA